MFNKIKIEFAAIISLFAFFSIHCSETAPEKYYPMQASYSFTGTSDPYDFVDTTENVYLDYTFSLDPGMGTKNIYFIFTNVSMSSSAPGPRVAASNLLAETPEKIGPLESIGPVSAYDVQASPIILKDLPAATESNRKITPPATGSDPGINKSIFSLSEPRFSSEGDPFSFWTTQEVSKKRPATCRKVVSVGSTTLNIWVADNCWVGAGVKTPHEVNQVMVDAMADKFLKAGADNDIYDWVTTIYGDEWGTPPAPMDGYLIPDNNEITILLFDPEDAFSIPTGQWIAGYFWSKDNYQYVPSASDERGFSNGRIMFYLDAVHYADDYNANGNLIWDVDDYYPKQIISTLAHEFQHMVHFYQKAVKQGSLSNSDAWIDEMCSMVTEDLIASKLGVDGPRGYDYNQPGPGLSNNRNGRLPLYNVFNDTSVAYWASTLADYSTKYAFGAYLARNFGDSSTGGANFFNSIVQSPHTDYIAVMDALDNAGNSSDDFGMILRRWGIANILSDDTGATVPYQYNHGGASWKESTRGITTYELGSINLYNYYDVVYAQNGPRIYTYSNLPSASLAGTANRYYSAGTVTGPWTGTWTITMDKNTRLTVLIK